MFLGHYNVFNTLTFQRQTVKSNIFGTYLTHLEVSLCASFKKNFLLHLQFDQAFANLFTPKLNAICFVTVNSNFYTLPFNNLFQYYLITVFITRAPLFSPFNSKCSSSATSDRFVLSSNVISIIIRVYTLSEIRIALLIAGIEFNPGPDVDEPNNISKFKIITINCNGLTCSVRLLQTIGKLKKHIKKSECIIFLQETHNANLVLLESIWEGSVHISPGTGGSKGVITLCTRNLNTICFKTDEEGRFLFTTIKLPNNRLINTANLYSPNDHNLSYQFISETFNEWNDFCINAMAYTTDQSLTSSVIAGDFNCVLNLQDSQQRTWSAKEQHLADHIRTNIENQEMYDSAIRSQNGNNFTWNRGEIFSKIDHIFVTHDLLASTTKYNTIWDLVKSDHAAIQISINLEVKSNRGRSYPKLSLSDLKGNGVIGEIRDEIHKAIKDFPPHWNPHLKLDYIKLVIRTKILEIRAINKKNRESLQVLRDNVTYFNSLPLLNNQQVTDFANARSELYKAEECEAERLRLAAGVKWREQGERSNKFFLNAINVNKASSTLDYLNTPDGKVNNMSDILEYAKGFYSNLYDKHQTDSINDFYQHCPSLTNAAHLEISQPLTINNLKVALKSCKDSTPGLDGIPYSYYKIFGNELLPLILDSWEFSNETGSLPQSQTTSVISLIPKAGKDKHEIKNWRPISISSCDLKIITKAYSLKVGSHLGEIISESQMGYVPGRNINFNNRILRLALDFCNSNNLDYSIMSLDAQKAYDSVDHVYISNTLKAYGFPDNFISAVDVLHSNLQAQVQVNGFLSTPFSIRRGVKQGDALSCALFIIAIDPLIRNIEMNQNIPELPLAVNCNIKTVAYADDIAIISKNSEEAFNNIFTEYGKLTKMSGLTLNADKTEILNLSNSDKQSSRASYLNNELTLRHKLEIMICGNCLSLDPSRCYEVNITEKITKLRNQLNRWKGRQLSINGKMIIIKTFAISQLIYSSQFQVINSKDVRKIEHLCYNFLWNGPDHVKRVFLKSGRDEGGINGIDIESFFNSIAVRQFLKSYENKTLAIVNDSATIKEEIKTQARLILKKVLLYQLNNVDIFDEKLICQTRADFFVKPFSKTHQLMNKLNISNIFSISSTSMSRGQMSQIRRVLPPRVLAIVDNNTSNVNLNTECSFSILCKDKMKVITKTTSKEINDIIKCTLRKKCSYHPADKYPIDRSFFGDIRLTWHNLWRIRNPTLRAIRLKVLYKDIWCQDKRFRLGISTDDKCIICGETETAIHQLYMCSNAKRIWNIGRKLLGSGELSLVDNDQSTFVKLIEISPQIPNEIIKSVIFKLLIQIDRSRNLNEIEIKRIFAFWVNIEYLAMSKTFKNNVSQLAFLKSIVSKLGG